MSLCTRCEALDLSSWFDETTNTARSIELGIIKNYIQTRHECVLCGFICAAFALQFQSTSIPGRHANRRVTLERGYRGKPWFNIIGIHSDIEGCDYLAIKPSKQQKEDESRVCIFLEAGSGVTPRQPPQSAVPGCLDYSLVKEWLLHCRNEHDRTKCGRKQWSNWDEIGSNGSLFLVDTQTRSLVRARPDHRYVALSYVWGIGRSRASNDWAWNTTAYETDPDLFRLPLPDRMPRTIEDALTLTVALDERYLWVDFYCVNQQDEAHVVASVKRMASIYKCAEVTIIAYDGTTSDSGLAGISRPLQQKECPRLQTSAGNFVATFLQAAATEAGVTEWDRRGWTAQEYILSDRCIVMDHNNVTWKCKSRFLHDCLPQSDSLRQHDFQKSAEFFWDTCDSVDVDRQDWSFATYSDFLAIYSGRLLSHPGDALRACQGILHHLSNTTGVSWIQGLPVQEMPAALSWVPYFGSYVQHREEFPSWTWLGWQGRIEYAYWLHDAESFNLSQDRSPDQRQTHRVSTYPPAQWATNESELWMTSYMAKVNVRLVRRAGSILSNLPEASLQRRHAVGDHWTVLTAEGNALIDGLGEYQEFETTDHLFRLAPEVSRKVQRLGCVVHLLFLKSYDYVRDSEQSGRTANDISIALVLIPDHGDKYLRIASIAMPSQVFVQANPTTETVKII